VQQGVHRERRRFFRIPLNVPLCLKTEASGSPMGVVSIDLSPYGIQIKSDSPVSHHETVTLRPGEKGPKTDYVAKGQIRWVKQEKGKFRSGIAFENVIDWPFSISDLAKGLETGLSHLIYFQYLLDSLDDGVLILDSKLNIVFSNINQPFCLPRDPEKLHGKHFTEVCSLFKSFEGKGSFKELLDKAMVDGEEVRVSAFPCDLPWLNDPDCHRYYNIWLLPLIGPEGTRGLFLRNRDVTALRRLQDREKAREKTLWQQYRHFIFGQLFDDLLEDIANPLSAIIGRLDLMTQKMSSTETPIDEAQIKAWASDIESIQIITGQIKEFCWAIARRRKNETIGAVVPLFSLNSLIEDELRILDLHFFFRKINKQVSLSSDLPPLQGYYSEWANAFLALCLVLMRQMSTLDNMQMSIQTFKEDEDLVLRISHNGKALNTPLDKDPALNILLLLKKKYGVNVYVSGDSGFQTVILKTATSKMQEL
jgi:hypothetical protein